MARSAEASLCVIARLKPRATICGMRAKEDAPTTIDEYIDAAPREVRSRLQQIRATIREAAPDADEAISYQMPTFKQNGNLVHFAAFKNHIGLYPTAGGSAAFQKELSRYKCGKGSVQFPLDQPIPHALIAKIVKYRVKTNRAKADAKRKAR
jgi:uncharacterized protein YdhG (YjbR/CyaY superfamily)